MIVGFVDALRRPVIELQIAGRRSRRTVDAAVDTGFTGYIALPRRVVLQLKLEYFVSRGVRIGDNTVKPFEYYKVRESWDGRVRHVLALCSDAGPLVGTSMLLDHTLFADVIPGGVVRIAQRT